MNNNKKKILFIAPQPFFEIRGTPIANKNMLEILSSEYEVDFLSYPIGKNIEMKNVNFFKSKSFGIKNIKIGFSLMKIILDFGLYLKTKELLKNKEYDVIHANEESVLWANRLAKKYNTKFVYDMDSIISEQLKNNGNAFLARIMKTIEKSAIKNSDLILGISSNFENFCRKINSSVNYVTIWDVPQISEKVKLDNRFSKELDRNKLKILYIGNNEYYQGIDMIIKLAKELPEYQFILAGVGVNSVEKNLVKFSKIPMEQVFDLMNKVDLLISPRRSGTNTPMKIYTYMASGKPIVASNILAHDILNDCAILVKQDIDSYVFGINKALSEYGKENAKKAKIIVNNKYNFKKLEKSVIQKYKRMTNDVYLKISVIMSVHNEPLEWISDSIDSILAQTFSNFEFIIINDNPDRTELQKFLEKYIKQDSRIILIKNDKNFGLTKSLNSGLKISKGKYIARMDADDISLPKRFEKQFDFLEKNKSIFLVSTGANYIDKYGNFLLKNIPPVNHNAIVKRLKIKNCLLHPTIMFRNNSQIEYRDKLLYVEDYDFYLNIIAFNKKLHNLNEVLFKCRISKNSIRHTKAFYQKLFANKARDFYFEKLKKGKDSYDEFDKNEILELKESEVGVKKEYFKMMIKTNFILGRYLESKNFTKKYFESYGMFNKFLLFYLASFLNKKIIRLGLRFLPTFVLRKLNN